MDLRTVPECIYECSAVKHDAHSRSRLTWSPVKSLTSSTLLQKQVGQTIVQLAQAKTSLGDFLPTRMFQVVHQQIADVCRIQMARPRLVLIASIESLCLSTLHTLFEFPRQAARFLDLHRGRGQPVGRADHLATFITADLDNKGLRQFRQRRIDRS